MGGGLALWRGASKGSVARWTVGEGRGWGGAPKNQLLRLGITNDDGIIMTAGRKRVSIHAAWKILLGLDYSRTATLNRVWE